MRPTYLRIGVPHFKSGYRLGANDPLPIKFMVAGLSSTTGGRSVGYSHDGINWTIDRSVGGSHPQLYACETLGDIGFASGRFVGGDDLHLRTLDRMESWEYWEPDTSIPWDVWDIGVGQGKFLMAAEVLTNADPPMGIYSWEPMAADISVETADWSGVPFTGSGRAVDVYHRGIAFGNGVWMAVGGYNLLSNDVWHGVIHRSTTGSNFQFIHDDADSWYEGIHYHNGRWMVSGGNRGIWGAITVEDTWMQFSDDDGNTWQRVHYTPTNMIWRIAANGNVWVGVGPRALGVSRNNGLTWDVTALTSGFGEDRLYDVIYSQDLGLWIIVGSKIWVSDDNALNWNVVYEAGEDEGELRGIAEFA